MATLLTSATHHPYEAPGHDHLGHHERYLKLIEEQDALVADVIDILRKRGQYTNTFLVVVGDHGEGFGDKGVRQHDNNYFEEGLRVPFLLHGPGVKAESSIRNASHLDILPTVLDHLNLRSEGTVGRDLRETEQTPQVFGCFYPDRCLGLVYKNFKIVEIPKANKSFYLDLNDDKEERYRQPLDEKMEVLLRNAKTTIMRRQIEPGKQPPRDAAPLFEGWMCNHRRCRHISRPKGGFFKRIR